LFGHNPSNNSKIALLSLADYLISKSGFNSSTMKRAYLGEFEEIVLLVVAMLEEDAYGVRITHEILAQTQRSVRLNQVHASLHRLEEKGMIVSRMGDPTPERGGRRKRIFTITAYGRVTLNEMKMMRAHLWNLLPSSFIHER
jgi:PadR family transcriptional regulator, regulatory protein PadR